MTFFKNFLAEYLTLPARFRQSSDLFKRIVTIAVLFTLSFILTGISHLSKGDIDVDDDDIDDVDDDDADDMDDDGCDDNCDDNSSEDGEESEQIVEEEYNDELEDMSE